MLSHRASDSQPRHFPLQVRRAMEGSRRLGMIAAGPDRTLAPVGAECEITECQPLPDGCVCARVLKWNLRYAATGSVAYENTMQSKLI